MQPIPICSMRDHTIYENNIIDHNDSIRGFLAQRLLL